MPRDIDEAIELTLTGYEPLGQASKGLRGWLTRNFLESPLRPVKNFLNGTWLEHPLHPVLVDLPIGGWTAALALDAATVLFGVQGLGKAAGIAIGVGALGAAGSIASGLMDYTDTDPPQDRVILTHGLVNITATMLFTASLLLRARSQWRTKPEHVLLAGLGYGLVTAGGFLGGSFVYRHGVMVNRNAFRDKPNEFTHAIALADLPENQLVRVYVAQQPVLLVRRGEMIYAVGAVCSHLGAPLEKGKLDGDEVECPWHYSRYKLQDGSYTQGPTTSPLPAYEARVNNGQVQVRMLRTDEIGAQRSPTA